MMIILPVKYQLHTQKLPVLLFTKDRYSPPGFSFYQLLPVGLPLPKVAAQYTPLTHKASKAIASRMRVSLRPVMELAAFATTSLQKGIIERNRKMQPAAVYVPACICAFF